MGLLDNLNKLIIGSDKVDDLNKVKQSINRLDTIKTSNEIVSFSELVKAIYSDNMKRNKSNDIYSDMYNFLKDIGFDFSNMTIENDRMARYKEYDAIVRKIPYMKRALKVIKQNIMNPEDYSKQSLKIFLKNEFDDTELVDNYKYEKYEKDLYNLLDKLEIEKYSSSVIYNTLKFGDYFVEILVLPEIMKQAKLLSESSSLKTILSENIKIKDDTGKEKEINFKIDINLGDTAKFLNEDITLSFDDSNIVKSNLDTSKNRLKKLKLSSDDIYLNFLPPHQVIRLGDRFCMGYIVLKNINSENNDIQGIDSTVNKLYKQKNVANLSRKIIQRIRNKFNEIDNMIKTEKDLRYTLARFLATSIDNTQISDVKLSMRFVPNELMEHFTIDTSEFSPYGTSVLYGSEFLAKVVVAIQSSIMIQRLSRSVEKRVIRVDIGATRDARRYITEVKNQFNRRRFSADSNGTVDDIPSSLSTFEDIYIPVKNGRTPVEFDTLPAVGDISARVDDLKALRDNLVASTDVPPPYIGIEENTESKAQLSQENVIFAATIINYQKEFSNHFTSLLGKINSILNISDKDLEIFNKYVISFEPPTSIIMEHKSDYLQNISSVIESLSNLGVSKEYLITKFIPQIKSWSQQNAKVRENLRKIYDNNGKNEEGNESGFGGEEFGSGGGGSNEF